MLSITDEKQTHQETVPLNDSEREYLTGLSLAVCLGSITLVSFLVLLDMSILGTAIPQITTEFDSLPDVGWYISAYMFCAATLQPFSGKLYSKFSNKYTYLAFLVLFELGSLVCGLATSSSVFIAGRVIAGLGAAGLFNGGMTIIASAVPLEKSPLYTGILAGCSQLGIVAGPLIGGALTQHVSWRWCFYINLPVGGAATVLYLFVHIPEMVKKDQFSFKLVREVLPELDLIGFALFSPAAIMFLLALQFGSGNTYAWRSPTIIGLLCGAAVGAVIFLLWEKRMGDQAMIPGTIIRRRIVWTSCVYASALVCCNIVASNWLPTYFQAVKGEGATLSGIHVLPSILGSLLFVVISGAAITRLGYYLPWGTFAGVAAAIGTGLISTLTPTSSVTKWVIYQLIFGFGRGTGLQIPIVATQNAVSPAEIPIALAVLIFFQNFSSAIGGVISNTIFTQTLKDKIPIYAPSLSIEAVLKAGSGASAIRGLVPVGREDELSGLLRAYCDGLRNIFCFLTGLAVLAMVVSFGLGWKDVRKKQNQDEGDTCDSSAA
ncbi:hypothetical protein E8E13_005809 [Curvularia kusanoi]|uniref:Major facilitator superfamily (MFS) profile domain-containing protein n=1 Tax=Curvularia kusanoi TaxID=90978 RepID=A0A9P4W6Z5_CURKU|nr:hypothetical protein E8E13_005809 [Curvularia kusanoi]